MPTTAATVTAAIAGNATDGEDFGATSSFDFGAVGLVCSSSSLVYCIEILMIDCTVNLRNDVGEEALGG